MTLLEPQDRVGLEQIAVRVVDADVHPTPRAGELDDHIPEPERTTYRLARRKGGSTVYDAPDYAHAMAMRTDSFPGDGNFAGSDPDLAMRHVLVEGGSDIGILEPLGGGTRFPEANHAIACAYNSWLADTWLGSENNWHERWRGSISVGIETPERAAREIENWAEHPFMSQVLIQASPRPAWGDPMYDPVWAAATKHDIIVACHLTGTGTPPMGFQTYNHDYMVTQQSTLAISQVESLIFDGTFDRFPTLRIALIEYAFNWILPLMWRMDAIYEARKGYLDIKRKPSEYVKDNIKFTTQPLDYPDDKTELTRALEWMEADKLLLFSSDYPHWTYDDPQWLVKHLPEHMRERIMCTNGLEAFKLPATVPAIPGQRRITY